MCFFLASSVFFHPSLGQPKASQNTKDIQSSLQSAQKTKQQLLKQKEQEDQFWQLAQQQKRIAQKKALSDTNQANHLNTALIDASQELQETEKQANDLEERLDGLKQQEKKLNQQLTEESQKLKDFLPLIERLSLYPADTLLAAPINSSRATIGISILQGLSTQLEKQAQIMKMHQESLQKLRKELLAQGKNLEKLHKKQTYQRDRLTTAARQARQIQQQSSSAAAEAAKKAAAAAKKANDLNDAIRKIELARRIAEKKLQAEAAKAARNHQVTQANTDQNRAKEMASENSGPGLDIKTNYKNTIVVGPIVTNWKNHTDSGPAEGITFAPPSQAIVRSPCSGQIEFAAPFRAYGQMIILNCGKKYRFVVAGMGQIDVSVGQSISKGVIVGRMPSWSGNDQTGRPTLYIQLRYGEKTINPSPFL